ncbi:MAG: cyclic nucleotide-binding domain-containing protein [Myxococcaceae bacterium]
MDSAQLKSDASAALAHGDFARAGALFASYCATAPNDRQSLLRMGDAWARAGERTRAIDAYLAAAQGFATDGFLARAIAASKLVLELEPGHQRMQRILADLYAQRGVGPGVGRRSRPSSLPSPPLPAAVPTPPAAAAAPALEEEAPELMVTEFVLQAAAPERSLEDALTEAVGSHAGQEARAPAEAAPLAPAVSPPMLFASPALSEAEAATSGGAAAGRFSELSLDEAELTAASAPPVAPARPAPPRFTLAEPGPAAVAAAPSPVEPPAVLHGPVEPALAAASEALPEAPPAVPAESPEARYIDLSFDDDEPLEASSAEVPASAQQVLADEPIPERAPVNSNGAAEALARAVPKAPLFSDLSSEAFVELVERCPLRHFSAGERILQQDAPGEAFYVICEGQVAVRREEGSTVLELARLSEGDFFGEMALLSGAPRVASVDALQDGTLLLEISTALLSELTLRHPGVATALKKFCRQRLVGNLMATSALFRPLSRADRRELASGFRARDVLAGDVVLREGGRGDGLYLVLAGLLEVSRGGFRIAKLGQGEVFGETSLLGRRPVVATVRALQRTSLLRLPEEDFARMAERYPAVRAHLEALRDARARENARIPIDPGEAAALLV